MKQKDRDKLDKAMKAFLELPAHKPTVPNPTKEELEEKVRLEFDRKGNPIIEPVDDEP